MSPATALRGDPVVAPGAQAGRGAPVEPEPVAVRLVAALALGAWGAAHWAAMVAPPATGTMMAAVALAAVGALCLRAARGLDSRRRWAARAAVAAAGLLAGGRLVGAPLSLLVPAGWPELAGGLAAGLTALPDLRIPYAGEDSWPRLVMLAGGAALLLAGAVGGLRARGRARSAAAVALVALYAVPAVELSPSGQFARGAVFALLLAAFLWLDGVGRADAGAAVALAVASIGLGAALAPRIDGARPWVPYESIAESLGSRAAVSFDWDHAYEPLDWPRDGRELFRVRTPQRMYWKTATLDSFDGRRWRRDTRRFGATLSDELPDGYRRTPWARRVRVTVRSLRSRDLVGAGTTLEVDRPPSAAVGQAAPGTFALEQPLRRGDSYVASVHAPRPSAGQLAGAGIAYPQLARRYLELRLPPPRASRATGASTVVFGRWGSGEEPRRLRDGAPAASRLGESDYAGSWALSRRLASRSSSPYDYTQRVIAHLASGYLYTEDPVRRRAPLEAFLMRDRAGYCQHFSGAMAMLLRMGGVPARVAAGFSPGAFSARRGEWVVRDLDAHSWVEAYFPGYGWVAFDPTPSAAPARSQITYRLAGLEHLEAPPGSLGPGDRPQPGRRLRGGGGGDEADEGGAAPRRWPILVALALLAAAGGAAVRARRRRGPAPASADPRVAELERALARSGQPAPPGTTLRELERRLGPHDADAGGYVRALSSARYGGGGAGPTPAQRRGLRRALGRGAGRLGRLRAWWALPPRLPGGPTTRF